MQVPFLLLYFVSDLRRFFYVRPSTPVTSFLF